MAKAQNITLKSQVAKGKGKTDKDVILILQGELTLDSAEKMRQFFLENLQKYDRIVLKVNNVESIDLGAIQLIQRFQWDAQAENKEVEVSITLSEDHSQLLARAGFRSFVKSKN